jgi:hypothetical protein
MWYKKVNHYVGDFLSFVDFFFDGALPTGRCRTGSMKQDGRWTMQSGECRRSSTGWRNLHKSSSLTSFGMKDKVK